MDKDTATYEDPARRLGLATADLGTVEVPGAFRAFSIVAAAIEHFDTEVSRESRDSRVVPSISEMRVRIETEAGNIILRPSELLASGLGVQLTAWAEAVSSIRAAHIEHQRDQERTI